MCGKGKGKSQTQTQEDRSLLLLRLPIIPVQRIMRSKRKKELFFSRVSFPTAKSNFINEPTGLTEREGGRREASIR